jgi:hypothetical protein
MNRKKISIPTFILYTHVNSLNIKRKCDAIKIKK